MRNLVAMYLKKSSYKKTKSIKSIPFSEFILSIKQFMNHPNTGNKIIEVYIQIYIHQIDPKTKNFRFLEQTKKIKKTKKFNSFKKIYLKNLIMGRTVTSLKYKEYIQDIYMDAKIQKRFLTKYPYSLSMILDLGINITMDSIYNSVLYLGYLDGFVKSVKLKDRQFMVTSMSSRPSEVFVFKMFQRDQKIIEMVERFIKRFEEDERRESREEADGREGVGRGEDGAVDDVDGFSFARIGLEERVGRRGGDGASCHVSDKFSCFENNFNYSARNMALSQLSIN